MIGVELLRELIETVILTGRVQGCDPMSLLLIAAPESGKTSVVLERPCKMVEPFTDITGRGIHQVLAQNSNITHIVINDMVAVLSHRQSVNKYTISQLNAITEEGITKLALPSGVQSFNGTKKMGVIASLTLDLVKDSRNWWNKVGFASRMLPFCYYYPTDIIVKIKAAIDEKHLNKTKKIKPKEFRVPEHPINVAYTARLLADVRWIADNRSNILCEQGMRRLNQYHCLVQSHAIWRQKAKCVVTTDDVDFLKLIDRYVSYDKPFALGV